MAQVCVNRYATFHHKQVGCKAMTYEAEEKALFEKIAALQAKHAEEIRPYIERLTQIQNLRHSSTATPYSNIPGPWYVRVVDRYV